MEGGAGRRRRGALGRLHDRRRRRAALLPRLRDRRPGRRGAVRGRHAPAVVRRAADARRGARVPGPAGRGARAAGAARRPAPERCRATAIRSTCSAPRCPARRLLDPDAASSEPEANLAQGVPPDDADPGRGRGLASPPHRAGSRSTASAARTPTPPGSSRCSRGGRRRPTWRACIDVVLTLHADHEFNASTFAARVAVATRADLHSAIVAAIATLKGPSHGGANEDVLLMLREIGDPAKAEAFVESAARHARTRSAGSSAPIRSARVPGLRASRLPGGRRPGARAARHGQVDGGGHRPRSGCSRWPSASTTRCARAPRLPVNVDFFSAVVYDALGIPPDLCTSIFAIGRVAGWCAHALEQYADNRLIRPRADYTGPAPRPLPRERAMSPSLRRARPDGAARGRDETVDSAGPSGRGTRRGRSSGGSRPPAGCGCFLRTITPQAIRAPEFPVGSVGSRPARRG